MIARWGVRARVMVAAVVPMLALAVVLTVFFTSSRLADMDEALTARGTAFARQLAAASEYAVFSGNRDALQQLASAVLAEDDIVGVSIVDRNGETLARSGMLDGQLPPLPTSAVLEPSTMIKGPTLRIIEPIRPNRLELDDGFTAITLGAAVHLGEAPLGSVVLELSLKHLHGKRDEMLWAGAGSVLLVLVGSLLLASHLSRGVSGPIRVVAHTVARIGQGKLGERVPLMGGGSLRTLAEGVNEMAEKLASSHEDLARRIEEATAELRARKEEAETANLAKSRFLAAASHDLRQPMHALGLFITELSQHAHAPQSRRLVQRIAASAEAMENLLDSLLDISKLDAGVLQPSIRPFALQPMLLRIAAEQRSSAEEQGLQLKVRTNDWWVDSDPVLLERIVTNLVSNAIRYTPTGRILIAARKRGKRIHVEVRDSGIGIPPDAQEIIFQEFVQLDNNERARDKGQGLGLGLAIVRKLADLLGHGLGLRSTPGRGSVFTVDMPMAPPPAPTQEEDNGRAPGDLQDICIALLDDDPLACAGMEGLLSSWGCEVIPASTADDLLAMLADSRRPDMLISDFRLHGPLNGVDVVHAVRKQLGEQLPAILISGDTGADTQALAQEASVPLLHKPVRPARLRALINRLHNPV